MSLDYFEVRGVRRYTQYDPPRLQQAREQRIKNHYYRKHVLDCLREGHLTLAQFRDMRATDKRLHCLKLRTILEACVGKKRAGRFLLELNIDGERKTNIQPETWRDLIGRVDSARPRTA